MLVAKPNAAIETLKINSPTTVVRRTPARVASHTASSEPGIIPAGYAATRRPIAGFEACSVCW